MEGFADQFKICDIREHVKMKGLWAGSIKPMIIPDLYGFDNDNKLVQLTKYHTPALLKAIDEIIVNAVDHTKGNEKNKISTNSRVTNINISFKNKTVSVFNNGPGIPIVKNKELGLYLIEIAFSKFLTGTNIEKPVNSIKGGINGLGAKLANVHSNIFTVETVSNGYKYIQTFKNRLSVIETPIITKVTKESEYTRVTFELAWKELGYKDEDNYEEEIDYWLRLRTHQVAVYLGYNITVTYNDTVCLTNTVVLLAKQIDNEAKIVDTTCKNTKNGYNINIAAIISDKKIKKKTSVQHMSIINGVISNKGSHINYIKKVIKESVTTKMNKLTKGEEKQDVFSNIKLIISGSIPGIDWSGQNKNEVQVSNKVLEDYKIPQVFLKTLCDTLLGKMVVSNIEKKDIKVEHDKYIKAKNISISKLRKQCMLLVAEGDSAITLLRSGLTQKCNKQASSSGFSPSFDWCGIISLQGVIINAARETTLFSTDDNKDVNIRSIKLKNNKRLNMLADAFGLKYEYTYETEKELNTLNYGKLILCVDQDVDGTGKIASLVLVWLYTFWPNLLSEKRVGKLMTPLIRAYPKKGKPIEFYYENELDHTIEQDPNFVKKHSIKYFKGLATHDSSEATDMFISSNFNKIVYMYTMDDAANELFKIYFGSDPSLRKQILITPVRHLTYDESINLRQTQEIPIGKVQLDIDTKLYKNDAINRQLPHIIDGLNPARRKILMGSIIRFNSDSKELKVFQLGGYVADKMLYHHGDMSLNKTITYMAQSFTGARKYPYLIGVGQFGDRHGSKAGSARYIAVKLNPIVNHIFPTEDRWLLSYLFDEGIRAEPEYFIPIIPMAILESYQIVSEGWNHKSFGRSLEYVIRIVKDYIKGDKELIELSNILHETDNIESVPYIMNFKYPLPIDGDIRTYKGNEYSFGNYYCNGDVIHIIELPIGVITNTYIESLEKLKEKYIDKIEDYSSVNEIEINIYLKPNVMNNILNNYGDSIIDPIEDFLNLRASLKPNLNYYSCKGGVLEFNDNYLASILYWAPKRRNLYKARLVRKEILLRVLIIKEESIIKYIKISNKLNISSIEDDIIASEVLANNSFPKINSSLLSSPGYINNDSLENSLLHSEEATYDYILDLRERDLTINALTKRQKNIEKYINDHNVIKSYLNESPFPGATLWLQEIDSLLKILNR